MANFNQAPSFCVFFGAAEEEGERKEGRGEKNLGKSQKSRTCCKLKFYIHFYIKSNISNNLISFIHPLLDHV